MTTSAFVRDKSWGQPRLSLRMPRAKWTAQRYWRKGSGSDSREAYRSVQVPLKFHHAVDRLQAWSAASDGISFVISRESRAVGSSNARARLPLFAWRRSRSGVAVDTVEAEAPAEQIAIQSSIIARGCLSQRCRMTVLDGDASLTRPGATPANLVSES